MVICEHTLLLSNKEEMSRTKFFVSIKPKLFCMPKIYNSSDEVSKMGKSIGVKSKLMDFCYVKSPANHILSSSQYLLLTIHQNIVD